MEDDVGAFGIYVFGVEQEAVHVEEAGTHGREAAGAWVSIVLHGG